MDLTPANIRALRTTVNKDFRDAYDETEIFYPKIAVTIPSSSSQNDYAWMASLPQMREWVGPRVVNNLITHSHVIVNKTFELTFGALRDDIEDDNLGIYTTIAQANGEAARKHPDSLMVTLLQTGDTVLAFDGQFYFDTDHPVARLDAGLGTYSNFQSSGQALTQDNFFAVRATMMSYKSDGDRPLKIMPDLIIVPPALEKDALEIVQAERNANGSSNISFRLSDMLVIPELAGEDTTWYTAATNRRIKGLVFQTRRPLNFQAKNRVDDEVVLEDNMVKFYTDARYNAGVSLPFLMHKSAA